MVALKVVQVGMTTENGEDEVGEKGFLVLALGVGLVWAC